MKNHICLITPPSPFLLDERVFMHIGILKVAAVLEQQNYKVDMLDLAGVEDCEEVIKAYYESHSEVVNFGITATTPQIPAAVDIAVFIRKYFPVSKIILGGTHVSLMHSAAKKEERDILKENTGRARKDIDNLLTYFDTLVAGDGEKAIRGAIENDIALIDADDPKTDLFLTSEELGELPFPARHLVDVDSYHYDIEGNNATSIICQLGCPFK